VNGGPRLSVVLPAYREAAQLAATVEAIEDVLIPLGTWEIIVVDDGSPDDTWAAVQSIAARRPALRALRLSRNFGKEAAVAAGLAEATGDAVIVMDADLQHPPELIPEMVRLWADEGFDVVNAVKRVREPEGRAKNLLTRAYFRLFAGLAGLEVGNATDFKLLDRCATASLAALPERRTFFRGLVGWLGYRQATVTFDVPLRGGGVSKWSLWTLARLGVDSILAFSTLPIHLITALGLVFAASSGVLGLRTIWLWATGEAVPGFTTVILLMILIGAILMIGLGIIGAYIAKIYEEVKGRPRFIVQESLRGPAPAAGKGRTARTAQAGPRAGGSRQAGVR
jgi:glycosyltransferase involved in cell wall biosynthesis